MLFNKHYVMLIYAMKLLFKYAMKLLFKYAMKLQMWGKGAFNILIWGIGLGVVPIVKRVLF